MAASLVLWGSATLQRCTRSATRREGKGFRMIQLHEKETGIFVGTVTDAQLQFLIEQLEEESTDDMDYYIDHATLDLFEARGAEAALLALLRQALGTRDGIEIVWS